MANFYSNINLKQNQLQYPVIHPHEVPSAGAEVEGQMYYDTGDSTMKYWNGSGWKSMENENTTYDAAVNHGLRIVTGTSFGLDLENMAADTTPASSDIMIVADPAADAVPKKVTLSQLATQLGVGGDQSLTVTTDNGTATDATGDLAFSIVGATNGGIYTAGSSTVVSAKMDIDDLTAASIASSDFIAFADATSSNVTKKESIDDVATLFAGTGLTASSAVIGIDAAQIAIQSIHMEDLTIGNGDAADEEWITFDANHTSYTGANNAGGIKAYIANALQMTLDPDGLHLTDPHNNQPMLTLTSEGSDPGSKASIRFVKDASDTQDGEDLGAIDFYGEDEGDNQTHFAQILGEISESDETDEAGKLTFYVAASDGTDTLLKPGLVLEGEHASDPYQVDVTIADGAASTTLVKGGLQVTTVADIGSASASTKFLTYTDGTTNIGSFDGFGTAAFLDATGFVTSFTAGDGLTEASSNTTGALTVNIDSNQTGHIATIHTADLRLGEDSSTQIDFETANEIHFDVDGSELANFSSAAATFNVDTFTVTSTNANDPVLAIRNTNADANPATLRFDKTSSSVFADDDIGQLLFRGQNDGPTAFDYASILVESPGITTSSEQGKMTLSVAAHQQVRPGIIMSGSATADEVDVTIGNGAASVVTIPGNLIVTGTTTTEEVTTVTTSNGVVFEGSSADDNEGLLKAGTLGADRTYTLPDATGTIALTSDISGTNSGTNTGDQLVFKTVAVDGGGTAVADTTTDTLTLTGGTNITTSVSADEVTFNVDQVALTKKAVIDVSSLTSNLTTTITHGLNSQNLNVTLWEDVSNGDYEQVYGTVRTIEANKITVDFDKAPSADVTVIMTRLSDITTIAAGGSIVYS